MVTTVSSGAKSNTDYYFSAKRYTGFSGGRESETPQNPILIDPWGAVLELLRSGRGGAHMPAQNKRERAGGHAREGTEWSQS